METIDTARPDADSLPDVSRWVLLKAHYHRVHLAARDAGERMAARIETINNQRSNTGETKRRNQWAGLMRVHEEKRKADHRAFVAALNLIEYVNTHTEADEKNGVLKIFVE